MTSVVSLPRKKSWLQAFSQKPNILILNSLKWHPAGKRRGSHIVLTPIIRLGGVDGLWLRQELSISVSRQDQLHNHCQGNSITGCFVSFVINISGAKSEECCCNISRLFFIQWVTVLVANIITASLS